MEISKTMQAGEMGTKALLYQYGNRLVCVRYRTDKHAQMRYTTVELIVNEKPIYIDKIELHVWVKIHYGETQLRQQAKKMGAQWEAEKKLWKMDYKTAKSLKLHNRIIKKSIK